MIEDQELSEFKRVFSRAITGSARVKLRLDWLVLVEVEVLPEELDCVVVAAPPTMPPRPGSCPPTMPGISPPGPPCCADWEVWLAVVVEAELLTVV